MNRGKNKPKAKLVVESDNSDHTSAHYDDEVYSDGPVVQKESRSRRPRNQGKTADDYRRVMDVIKSKISIIIDLLEGDDTDTTTKKNVATAVKHLKQIESVL